MRQALFALVAALILATPPAWAAQCSPAKGQTGQFDYYLLSLSWAPSYCATPSGKKNPQECGPGTSYGFVVHGLWPQYGSGQWPQCCQAVAPVSPSPVVDKAAQVIIGSSLMEHEWEKHGSCVTGDQDRYFGEINQVVDALGLAPQVPGTGLNSIKVSDLKKNWPAPPEAISVQCKGKRLTEVHVCLDKSLSPMACPPEERQSDNCPGTVNLH